MYIQFSRCHRRLVLLLTLLAAVCAGCGSSENELFTSSPNPNQPPLLSAFTNPADGATGVALNSVVTVTFSEGLDQASVNGTTFLLSAADGTSVAGVVTVSGSTATFTPDADLVPQTLYRAVITVGARSLTGRSLAEDYQWTFTTGADADSTAPTVTFTDPARGETDVPINQSVAATFSEALDPTSVSSATFSLREPDGTLVPGTVSNVALVSTFLPDADLTPNTLYTATITTGARDLAGNALASAFSWSFTTGTTADTTAPTVTFTDPTQGETGVPINQNISATFSEGMNPLTISNLTFRLSGPGATPVNGTVTYVGLVATFNPSETLAGDTLYTATVSEGATDLAGNPLASDQTWSFTTGATPDTTAPTVTFTDPASGETNVPINQDIAATFSEGMDPLTLTNLTFTLSGPGATPVSGTVTYVGLVATFNPSATLAGNTLYTATVSDAATDLAGNPLASDQTWSFTTGATPDTTAPTVTFTDPASGETNVPINQDIAATFSEGMDPLTLTNLTFTLSGPGATPVSGTVTYVGLVATFNPSATLAGNTLYTATVSEAATDLAGNPLASDQTWSFTTGATPDATAPTVTSVDPASGETGVPVNQDVAATFSEGMDPLTLTNLTFTLSGPGATPVSGTVTYVGLVATFNPSATLAGNTLYTATVSDGATDLAGNPLASDQTWSFTTGATPDTTAPTVTFTDPGNDATNVAVTDDVSVTFSEAMDAASLTNVNFFVTGVAGTVSYDVGTRTATFNPTGQLDINTSYDVTVTTGVEDSAGNNLAQTFTFRFTTAVVNLGQIAPFGSFGGDAGMTNQGLRTVVNGDIGTTAAATSITGFTDGQGNTFTVTGDNNGLVTGSILTGTNPSAVQGALDARSAYNALTPASLPGGTVLSTTELGNRILEPGIYQSATSYAITEGPLTLDANGDPDAIWVFQMGSSLTVGGADGGTPQSVLLVDGAQAGNVYWQVGSAATINAPGGGTMVGTIIAQAGVTFSTVGNNLVEQIVTLDGRAIGLDASVTLVNTVINIPAP